MRSTISKTVLEKITYASLGKRTGQMNKISKGAQGESNVLFHFQTA